MIQLRHLTTAVIVVLLTKGYMRAMALVAMPFACCARMAATSSGVSFERPCAAHEGWLLRCLLSMSRTLSSCVPRNRCAGFTHSPLSHLWQMLKPFGMGPTNNMNASRWASQLSPRNPTEPYRPCEPLQPVHITQSESARRSVLAMKLSRTFLTLKRPCRPQVLSMGHCLFYC